MKARTIQEGPASASLAGSLAIALALFASTSQAPAQAPAAVPTPVDTQPAELPPQVQVVRLMVPAGGRLELLGPPTEISLASDDKLPNVLSAGLKVGVAYRFKLSNMPTVSEGSELYPVIELVGHLHRPPGIDPYKYPIRISFDEDDLADAAMRGRMVTKVVYLEAPEQAIPINFPKDQTPSLTLSPAENPLKVAPRLGRVMAILRVGGRAPTPEELTGEPEWPLGSTACPFAGPIEGKCPVPCGPVSCTPPASGRPYLPKDEFLCDGGDHGTSAHFGGDGALAGIDPKDAVFRFQADGRPRVLPTNTVCIYAPRFAAVRVSVGPNEATSIDRLREGSGVERLDTKLMRQSPIKLTMNQAAELARLRTRASGFKGRVTAMDHIELRVLQGFDVPSNIAGHVKVQGPEMARKRQQGAAYRELVKPAGIKSAETAVVTGLVEGLGEKVRIWTPGELSAVEVPPNKPGLAVVKQVSAAEAEPGDEVTFTIRYRNMGNVPIRSVSVVDSLLPRLEYVAGTALGPANTVFRAAPNAAGSVELRWDLPGDIPPGAEGHVEFKVRVR